MSTTDKVQPPILSYRPPEEPVSSRRRYAALSAVLAVAVIANVVGVSANPFGLIAVLFWLDVFIAFSVPVAVWATRPRSVHWAACVTFAAIMLGVAALSLLYVAAVGASV